MPIKAVDCVDSVVSALVARVLVDPNQCASLAKRLNGVMIKPAKTLKIESNWDQENVARLLFFYMAICHDTRGLEGSLDGVYRRGSDYLYYALKRQWDQNPDSSHHLKETHTIHGWEELRFKA